MKKLTKKQREKFLSQIDNILKKYKVEPSITLSYENAYADVNIQYLDLTPDQVLQKPKEIEFRIEILGRGKLK